MNDETAAIHGHGYTDSLGSRIPPVYLTSIFEQIGEANKSDRGVDLKYSREENPTVRALEKALAKLEGSEDSLAFSSGMAAINAIYMNYLSSGREAIVTCEAYGTTIKLLQTYAKFGIRPRVVMPNEDEILRSVTKDTSFVLVESMSNPTLKVLDIGKIKDGLKESTQLIVDNTFLSPINYKPILAGASLVVESLTKYISGHNDVIAGMIAGSSEKILDLWETRRMQGTILSPFNAYLTLRGLKTIGARIAVAQDNALKIAKHLREHPKVVEVLYPCLEDSPYYQYARKNFKGCGSVVSFKVRGGKKEAIDVLRHLKLIIPSPSLGGTESIMTYPILSASSSLSDECKRALGISENLLRLSVGIENVEDLIKDIDDALSYI
ncbi:MAG: cystathionine gamma-synthase family protein [Nitrososphaeria archaeon]